MGMEPQFWDSSYKWPISITTLFFSLLFSQLCIHTDLGTSQRWINPDWKLLKCPQASKRYYLWGESVVKMIQKSENKLWGHLGWTNTHNAGISCKVHHTALSPIIFLDNLLPGVPVALGYCCWNGMNAMLLPLMLAWISQFWLPNEALPPPTLPQMLWNMILMWYCNIISSMSTLSRP